jgi:ABC-type oligopeptide transport system ATPase subunit
VAATEGLALSIRGVSKVFPTPEGGEVRALDDVSLEVADGSFMVLLGPSGCGKTTLLRCIAGLEAPDSGQIDLKGTRIDDVPANIGEATNFVGYDNGITGSSEFMTAELGANPAVVIPEEFKALAAPVPGCSVEAIDLYDQVWTNFKK